MLTSKAKSEVSGDEIELSVVMPCLDEAETIETCIAKAQASIARLGIRGEVVIADNGSSDGSREIARAMGARVVEVSTRGYGAALQEGIQAARGEFVIMGDADDSYDFSKLDPFLEQLRSGYDFVMGNRFRGGIAPGAMPPLHRYFGNPVLTSIGRLLFRSPSGDFQCGLRGFRRNVIPQLNLRTTGMEFASEMLVKATLMGLRITEVPTTLSKDGRGRPPHMRSWRDGWRNLRFLLLYSPRFLFLIPGALLLVAGLAILLWLLPGERVIGHVTFDIHTMLFAAASVAVGVQIIMFGLFGKAFATSEGLLPPDPRLSVLSGRHTLEVGILAGILLFFAGLGLAAYAVNFWNLRSFGPLNPQETMRVAIPAMLLLVLGVQVIFGSFFLSVLGLKRR
jgi:glycosyltransferase involved in cell wall biosynthesis